MGFNVIGKVYKKDYIKFDIESLPKKLLFMTLIFRYFFKQVKKKVLDKK